MRCIRRAALTALIAIGLAASAAAQQGNVTQADIQRLQDNVYQAGTRRDAGRARATPRAPISSRHELDDAPRRSDLSESEAAQGTARSPAASTPTCAIASRIFAPGLAATRRTRLRLRRQLRARLRPRRLRAARRSTAAATPAAATAQIPVGTELDVRVADAAQLGDRTVEDRFEATTLVDLKSERPNARAGGLGDARRGDQRRAGDPHQPHGAS